MLLGDVRDEQADARTKLTKGLVRGTWGLVFVGLIAAGFSLWGYSRLINEQQKSTEMEWRPYLHVMQSPATPRFKYLIGETDTSPSEVADIDSIKLGSTEYFAVRKIKYMVPRINTLYNGGKTPLRVKTSVSSILSLHEWTNLLGKSYEHLIDTLKTPGTVDTLLTDYVLLPGDSTTQEITRGMRRIMDKKEWHRYIDGSSIVLYPYLYVEYEDFFQHQYNALLIQCVMGKIEVQDSIPVFTWDDMHSVERYRWDIGLD